MSSRPSRTNRPWELSSTTRPVWAYPVCPEGHGRIFVGVSRGSAPETYECLAPWCPQGPFNAPDGWEEEL